MPMTNRVTQANVTTHKTNSYHTYKTNEKIDFNDASIIEQNKAILHNVANKIINVFDEVVLTDPDGFDYDIKLITKKINTGSIVISVKMKSKQVVDYTNFLMISITKNAFSLIVNVFDITNQEHPKMLFVNQFNNDKNNIDKLIRYLPKIIFSVEKDIANNLNTK